VREKELLNLEEKLGGSTKRILVIDDHYDSAFSIKTCLESYHMEIEIGDGSDCVSIHVSMYIDPRKALLEFKPYYYDLLLVDINMPAVNGYELCEKLLKLDLNIKVCFMSSGEINYEALREIHHPTKSFGCFIKKPATSDYLIKRVLQELC
jgi:CheY-like chemotaxis protein